MTAAHPPSQSTIGVFGYLPGQADFVRVRASSREVRRLEEWLERGLHQARWEMGGGFSAAYPRLFHRFVFRPDNSEKALLGVLCASLDCHGRAFPFVAFSSFAVADWDRDPARVVGIHLDLFTRLEELVRKVGRLAHIGQVHGCVDSVLAMSPEQTLGLVPQATGSPNAERYQNFLQETHCQDLGSAGTATGLAILYDLDAVLGGGDDPRLFRPAIALPLSRPTFARDLETQFYLAFVRHLLAHHQPTLSVFWQLGSTAAGTMFLSFREPMLELFSALLTGGTGSRNVYRPGMATSPLSRPRTELTGSTPIEAALRLKDPRTGRGAKAERNGARR